MDRLTGAYKRRAQAIAFIIGFFLALLLNVDTINVANSLWREPTLRQAIIAQAENYTPPATSQGTTTIAPLENVSVIANSITGVEYTLRVDNRSD